MPACCRSASMYESRTGRLPPGVKTEGCCADVTVRHNPAIARDERAARKVRVRNMDPYLMKVNFANPIASSPCQGQTKVEFRGDAFALTRT